MKLETGITLYGSETHRKRTYVGTLTVLVGFPNVHKYLPR